LNARLPVFFLALIAMATTARSLDFQDATDADGTHYTVCRVNLNAGNLRLFLRDSSGAPLKTFDAVNRFLEPANEKLLFAMNAGMYHADFSPVGLCVNAGREISPLNLGQHDGNFFLKPNGVFFINDTGAHIVESSRYPAVAGPARAVRLATQSGPMLVIDGKIHPVFRAESQSHFIRNGVGIVSAHEVVFAISAGPVIFYDFARFFRDTLHCRNALYLDGDISSLYAPPLDRNDTKRDLGPIIGVVGPR
jgi:uncharacterized protein YigE (DUF2233 family)